MGRPKERFCKRGHDTEKVGRMNKGWCKACDAAKRSADAEYRRELRRLAAQGLRRPKRKPSRHSPEWERDRVKRWLEIATEDPMSKRQGTTARNREFEARYQRLEADLPTPVDA